MSEHSQGPGWWLASDGKWYPPSEQTAAAEDATPSMSATSGSSPVWDGSRWTSQAADGSALEWDGTAWRSVGATPSSMPAAATSPAGTPAPPAAAVPAAAAVAPAPTPSSKGPARGLLLLVIAIFAVMAVVIVAAVAIFFFSGRSSNGGSNVSAGPVSGPDDLPSGDVKLTDATVVVRGNNGSTLKSIASDGTTFTLDGSADGVDKLEAGKVLLLTGVAAVKVTDVQRNGGDVVVKTEPAAIGDVITDADISWNDLKAGAGAFHVWNATDKNVTVKSNEDGSNGGSSGSSGPGTTSAPGTTERRSGGRNDIAPPRLIASTPMLGESAQSDGTSGSGSVGGFDYTYTKSNNGGSTDTYHVTVTKNDSFKLIVNVDAEIGDIITEGHLKVEKSFLNALKIKSNKWEGKATVKVEAGVGDTKEPIKTTILELPISVDYPIVIYGIPFNLNLRAKMLVEPAFTSKNSTVNGQATVTFGGNNGLSYEDGKLSADGAVTAEAPDPISYVNGLGIGVNGMIVAAQVPRIGFGLGWASSNAGVYVDSVTSVGITVGSSVGIVQCYQITVTYASSAGVEAKFLGKQIPGGEAANKDQLGNDNDVLTRTELFKKSWSFYNPKVKACELG